MDEDDLARAVDAVLNAIRAREVKVQHDAQGVRILFRVDDDRSSGEWVAFLIDGRQARFLAESLSTSVAWKRGPVTD